MNERPSPSLHFPEFEISLSFFLKNSCLCYLFSEKTPKNLLPSEDKMKPSAIYSVGFASVGSSRAPATASDSARSSHARKPIPASTPELPCCYTPNSRELSLSSPSPSESTATLSRLFFYFFFQQRTTRNKLVRGQK